MFHPQFVRYFLFNLFSTRNFYRINQKKTFAKKTSGILPSSLSLSSGIGYFLFKNLSYFHPRHLSFLPEIDHPCKSQSIITRTFYHQNIIMMVEEFIVVLPVAAVPVGLGHIDLDPAAIAEQRA